MTLGDASVRLWHALGMGPLWRERGAAVPGAAGAEVAALGWDELESAVAACTACALCRTRKQTVFAAGSRTARWMFIGEAPGAEEDARGEPFVGQAGKLLDNMLAEIGLDRGAPGSSGEGAAGGKEAVYIANVVKCRPPHNRNPEPAEVSACEPFLLRQIDLLQPRILVLMGRIAVQCLLQTDASIASLRGRVQQFSHGGRDYPVIVTYHPAYLLRTLADKARSWEDLCLARETFESAA